MSSRETGTLPLYISSKNRMRSVSFKQPFPSLSITLKRSFKCNSLILGSDLIFSILTSPLTQSSKNYISLKWVSSLIPFFNRCFSDYPTLFLVMKAANSGFFGRNNSTKSIYLSSSMFTPFAVWKQLFKVNFKSDIWKFKQKWVHRISPNNSKLK